MKSRIFTFLAGFLLLSSLQAQTKYAMIEHFTNSYCGTCASKNPTFFTAIAQPQYADKVHHMSVHPPVPYINCTLHQYNTALNNERSDFYGISSTPRIAINGDKRPSSTPLLQTADLDAALSQTALISVEVTESGIVNLRDVSVKITTHGIVPTGNYRLFVAMLEKTLNFTSPNGETVHHNVLRGMVSASSGDAVTLPGLGNTSTYTFDYTIPTNINANEVYALAWVQNMDTKAILNSGTKFDPQTSTSTNPTLQNIQVSAQPNPMTDILRFTTEQPVIEASLYDLNGKQVAQKNPSSLEDNFLDTNALPTGTYILNIRTEKGFGTLKVVK